MQDTPRTQPQDQSRPQNSERPDLANRYGAIGISAVAAAARYTEAKKAPSASSQAEN